MDTAYSARFVLDADPLELTPSDAVTEVTQDGETLVAQSSRGSPDREGFRRAAYILDRVETPNADPYHVITEQVVRNHQLRDTLALARIHDVSRVRLEEFIASSLPFGIEEDRY